MVDTPARWASRSKSLNLWNKHVLDDRIALEALAELLVGDVDGDSPAQSRVASAKHLPHVARAQGRFDLVWSQQRADRHLRDPLLGQEAGRDLQRWPLHDIPGAALCQRRLHLAAKLFIATPGFCHEVFALSRLARPGRVIQLFDLL